MATIDDLVTQGSVMPDNLRSDTARASLEYKNQLKNAGDIYVGTGTKITNDEAGVSKEIYVTEGKNIQTALNEDIFRASGKSNVNLSSSTLGAQSQYNVLIGSGASINGSSKNVVIGRGAQISSPFDNSIAIGNNANVNASGIAIGDSTRTTGINGVVIGDEAQNASTKGIAIGYKAKANTLSSGAIAIGDTAVSTAENAVQIGTGTNSVANTLKFRDTQIVDGDGSINATKINGVLSTDIFESDGKMVKDAKTAEITDFTNSEFQKVDFVPDRAGKYVIPANTFGVGTYEIKIYRKSDYDVDNFSTTCLHSLIYTFEDKNEIASIHFSPDWGYQTYETETDRQLTLTYFRFLLGNGGSVTRYTRYTGIAAGSTASVVSSDYRIRIRQIR